MTTHPAPGRRPPAPAAPVRSPSVLPPSALPGTGGSVLGHDFGRIQVTAGQPVAPRLRVGDFAVLRPGSGGVTGPDKSVAPLSELQDQGASVTSFGATSSGVSIVVEAVGVAPTAAHPDGFKFTQTIDTNVPLGGTTSPYVDPRPNDDTKPFYWTDAEQAANPTTFRDAPQRPAPATGTTNWDATLALNGVNEATRTVTAYDALTYGFSRDSAGAVTTRPPRSTSAGTHRSILASEFPGWTFTWGFTRGERAAIGALGGAATGAAIGGLAGGPLGALIGAGIGALAGGLGSLLF
nr:hypothetical protein [Micromonospora sp. DSM 115978]